MHRLLLADDSVTIQRVIELTFADEDIEVIAVGDGREAIRRIESDRPDIVLADVGMPEKDGYEVAAFVKNTPHLCHIPVLLLTGAFEPVDEQRAQEVGCDGVLAKPFEPQMVITRVNELLREAPPARAAAPSPVVAERPVAPPSPPPVERTVAAPPVAAQPAAHEPPPLSPLDAFLAAAPAMDLDAYAARPAAARAYDDQDPPDRQLSMEHERALEPIELPPAVEEGPSVADQLVSAPPSGLPAADEAAVRISRRTPIAVPGFGAPALPPASTAAELDDYFEKLDAAFASLQQTPVKQESAHAWVPPSGAGAQSSHPTEPLNLPSRWSSPPAEEPPSTGAGASARAVDQAPALAQAFSALLAAEHGQDLPGPSAAAIGAPTLSPDVIDELVDRVAKEVLERMSDRVVREAVTDIVSRIAEKLVREEIDRVKATIK